MTWNSISAAASVSAEYAADGVAVGQQREESLFQLATRIFGHRCLEAPFATS